MKKLFYKIISFFFTKSFKIDDFVIKEKQRLFQELCNSIQFRISDTNKTSKVLKLYYKNSKEYTTKARYQFDFYNEILLNKCNCDETNHCIMFYDKNYTNRVLVVISCQDLKVFEKLSILFKKVLHLLSKTEKQVLNESSALIKTNIDNRKIYFCSNNIDSKSKPVNYDVIYCGSFEGSLEDFEERVKEVHVDTVHYHNYMAMINYFKSLKSIDYESV